MALNPLETHLLARRVLPRGAGESVPEAEELWRASVLLPERSVNSADA